MTDTVSKKDQHLARQAQLKAEGAARRAEKKAKTAVAHRAFLDGKIAEGVANKAARIQGHLDRNAAAKKPANDATAETIAA